ncbi:hypothetical protein G6L94_29130 [Agrobacterium rhizogenes]|uniref:hypothetical protein n=1 Tax=Rhizobium rhizogenes TaxID=359 RepID=UPI000A84A6DE|nr:hypothetical protein [Rhizobium rhizogenes]NTF58858.1 hypothetical protein [Rhizobium rhizogenes]NTF65336.1 hypothetical protein [Rhizobium rhizogenes]NTF72038.1 hypothetical protein [Rhizobium rhizogenes]NTF78442.1 hypothetical protein [Rhizobium rhizogenes]NTF85029.1 hypothetical protein [Rhizobium rhizogenes]
MTSLLVLAILYLLAALVVIIIIDRSVGIMFPASGKERRVANRRPLPDVPKQSPASH